ncbi:MAG: hypothetical protein K9L02_02980 [Acholeplasmataceae bacterium]|nr:hypothetical protein [Acholeplasmataceae bacterium]
MFGIMFQSKQYSEIIANFELDSNIADYDNVDLKYITESYVNLNQEQKAIDLLLVIIGESRATSNEKIKLRKLVFEIFIQQKKYEITSDILQIFEKIVQISTIAEEKLNIVFIRQAIKYIKSQDIINYDTLLTWLTYYPVNLLNDELYGNQKYSESDLYHYDRFKCYCELGKIDEAYELYSETIKKIKNNELATFVKYNMCKMLFSTNKHEEAILILNELLIYQRLKYYLYLPIKYLYFENSLICSLILELVSLGIQSDEQYILKYIFDWIGKYHHDFYQEQLKNQVTFDGNMHINIANKIEVLSKISNFCRNQINVSIKTGMVIKITKTGNVFIKSDVDKKTIFVSKQNAKNIKINQRVEYINIDSYDAVKKTKSNAGIIIGGL